MSFKKFKVFIKHINGSMTQKIIEGVTCNAYLHSDSFNFFRNKIEVWVNINMYEYIVSLQNSYSEKLNWVISKTDFLLKLYAEGTFVKQSHSLFTKKGENVFYNLITDAIRTLVRTDITILNAGFVDDDILAGNII